MVTTNCTIHGDNVESLINRKCALCYKQKIEDQELIELQERLSRIKELSLIPKRFRNSLFDNYYPTNEKSQLFLEFCKEYEFNINVLMLGSTGTGKTHLACSLMDRGIKIGLSCNYIKFYQLADIKIRKPKLFDELLICGFLVIDEYGQQDSDFKSHLLSEIIDLRYDNEVYTVLISNLAADKFRDSIPAPLYSRLKENVIVKNCEWEDYRLTKMEVKQ
jgi:DNA replication protein DnaC